MTPAINLLNTLKVSYKIHEYQHESKNSNFGSEAALKLGVDPFYIFKTLVVEVDRTLEVVIIPVAKQLDLKKYGHYVHSKKVCLADPKKVTAKTGYIMGDVSPLGQKNLLRSTIDISASYLNNIFISGGKRGLDIEINPRDLSKIIHAEFIDISS